jgi:hypothetical protein
MAQRSTLKAKPGVTMPQVLYELDHGRLAAMRVQMDEIIMGQRAIVSELNLFTRRAQRDWTDAQVAMTDLLHRIMVLETK